MKKEVCNNCRFYTAYYKKWSSSYGRLKNGLCSKHNKPANQSETCECYKSNEQKERKDEMFRLVILEQAIQSINQIAQILKEKESQNEF